MAISWRLALASTAAGLLGAACGVAGPGAAPDSGPPASSWRLDVALTGGGAGRVTSIPAGIDCPGTCGTAFPAGTDVSFAATPAAGNSFLGWNGPCSGTGTCIVSSTAMVSATFAPLPATRLTVVPVATQVANIRLNPDPMRLFVRQWARFEARLNGLTVPRVNWSVREGTAAGIVAGDGTYTAPQTVGFYHLDATSVDDPEVGGSLVIQVVATQDLYDYGGAILPKPKVTLIWLGARDDFAGAVDDFHGFLGGVNGSAWLSVLDQYTRGDKAEVTFAGEIFEPAPGRAAPLLDPGPRICSVLARHGLSPDPGAIYSLMVAAATTRVAYHAVTLCGAVQVPIIVLSLPSAGAIQDGACGGRLTPAQKMVRSFSHELAETITDPYPFTAWGDIYGQEVADDCAHATCVAFPAGSYSLTMLLSNAAQGCAP